MSSFSSQEKAGWLPKKAINQIVTLMKKKIPKLKEKKGDAEPDLDLEMELPTFTTVVRSEGNEEPGSIFPAFQELAEIQPYNIFGNHWKFSM